MKTTISTPLEAMLGRGVLLLVLIGVPVLFSTATLDAFESPKLWLLHTAALALVMLGSCWTCQQLLSGGGVALVRQLRAANLCTLGAVLFLLSALLSTIFSQAPYTSLRGQTASPAGLGTIVAYVALFLAARHLCRGAEDVRRWLLVGIAGATIAGVYGLLQVAGLDPLNWARTSDIGTYRRPLGTMGHANFLAALLLMVLPAVICFGREALANRSWKELLGWSVVTLVLLAVVVLSMSRAAWVTVLLLTLLGAAVSFRYWGRQHLRTGGLIVAGLLVMAVAGWFLLPASIITPLQARLNSLLHSPSRWQIWEAAWNTFCAHPWLGHGLDTFEFAYHPHRSLALWDEEWGATPAKAHNELFQLLATQGLLGIAATLLFLGGLVQTGWRSWQGASAPERSLLVGLGFGLLGFLVQNLFSFTVAGLGTLAAIMAGALAGLSHQNSAEPAVVRPRGLVLTLSLRGLATCAFLGLAAVLVLQPLLADVACKSGQLLLRHSPHKALQTLQVAVAIDRGSRLHWSELGRATQGLAMESSKRLDRVHLLKEARGAFEMARQLEPKDPQTLLSLGTVLSWLGALKEANPEEVATAFDAALALDPRNTLILMEAGQACLRVGLFEKVKGYARQALALENGLAVSRAQLAFVALHSGDPTTAWEEASKARDGEWFGHETNRIGNLANLAMAAYQLGRYHQAAEAASAVLKVAPHLQRMRALYEEAQAQARYQERESAPTQPVLRQERAD